MNKLMTAVLVLIAGTVSSRVLAAMASRMGPVVQTERRSPMAR